MALRVRAAKSGARILLWTGRGSVAPADAGAVDGDAFKPIPFVVGYVAVWIRGRPDGDDATWRRVRSLYPPAADEGVEPARNYHDGVGASREVGAQQAGPTSERQVLVATWDAKYKGGSRLLMFKIQIIHVFWYVKRVFYCILFTDPRI